MTKTVDARRALLLLNTVVSREGRDTVRENQYLDRDYAPCCILGCILTDLGVPRVALLRIAGICFGEVVESGYLNEYAVFTEEAVELLDHAQEWQDAKQPWGDVLDKVREEYIAMAGS